MERMSDISDHDRPRRAPYAWEVAPIRPERSHLSYWLRTADTRVSGRIAAELKKWNLILSEWRALRQLYRANAPATVELAGILGMTKGGVSKLIDRLIAKGLVTREISEYDRRYHPLRLTPGGEDLVPILSHIEAKCDRRSFRRLGHKLRSKLLDALTRIIQQALPVRPRIRLTAAPPPPPPTTHGTSPATDYDPVQAILDLCARCG
jgi:MarR family transcriptional regulator, organic hydroperoxide resistance regulator